MSVDESDVVIPESLNRITVGGANHLPTQNMFELFLMRKSYRDQTRCQPKQTKQPTYFRHHPRSHCLQKLQRAKEDFSLFESRLEPPSVQSKRPRFPTGSVVPRFLVCDEKGNKPKMATVKKS